MTETQQTLEKDWQAWKQSYLRKWWQWWRSWGKAEVLLRLRKEA